MRLWSQQLVSLSPGSEYTSELLLHDTQSACTRQFRSSYEQLEAMPLSLALRLSGEAPVLLIYVDAQIGDSLHIKCKGR